MRLAFAGTPVFAQIALEALLAAGHELTLVLTQPDRPAGRGMKLKASPVKETALGHGLTVIQPQGLKLDGRYAADAAAAQQALTQARPDALVVAAYGLILPRWTLQTPVRGSLNIHASLLPRWRGAAPIQRAIEAGDTETGITIMQMDEGLDTGAVLRLDHEAIRADDNSARLHDRLAALGARAIVAVLDDLDAIRAQPQSALGVTYAAKIDKAEARLDWRADARQLERRIRAFDPTPGALATVDGQELKVWRAATSSDPDLPQGEPPGTVLRRDPQAWCVACGVGALALLEVQRPGGRRLAAADYLRGGT